MIEYAISNGEETLIDYGMTDDYDHIVMITGCVWFIMRTASPDCVTGE